MAHYTQTIQVPTDLANKIRSLENITGAEAYSLYKLSSDEYLSVKTTFPNGVEAEIHIVIPSNSSSYTWTYASLSYNHVSISGEPSETFFGEWYLYDNDNTYTLIVNG